jgi:hypothetical protein
VNPLARTAFLSIAAALLAGCGFAAMAQHAPEDLSGWSLTPLPPDPALAASVVAEGGACRMDENPADHLVPPAPQILVQDRRTRNTTAFLVVSPQHFGDCLVTQSGGSGGGFGPPLGAMNAQLTVDAVSSQSGSDGNMELLGGRIAIPGAQVVLELNDGRRVVASVANGYWLTWRPAIHRASRVVAIGPDGQELASVKVVEP